MSSSQNALPAVFTPDNEPYLGRQSVYHFDQVIVSCLEANAQVAAYTTTSRPLRTAKGGLPNHTQGINLALSIRELVRQGYLFAAAVLMRPLIERAASISYLHANPEAMILWNNGWIYNKRPRLPEMLSTMKGGGDLSEARKTCETFNSITHGDPISSSFNLVELGEAGLGYSVGKVLNHPELCDFSFQSYSYLIVLMGMMAACFPDARQPSGSAVR